MKKLFIVLIIVSAVAWFVKKRKAAGQTTGGIFSGLSGVYTGSLINAPTVKTITTTPASSTSDSTSSTSDGTSSTSGDIPSRRETSTSGGTTFIPAPSFTRQFKPKSAFL